MEALFVASSAHSDLWALIARRLSAACLVRCGGVCTASRAFFASARSNAAWSEALTATYGHAGTGNRIDTLRSFCRGMRSATCDFTGTESGPIEVVEGFGSGVLLRCTPCVFTFAADWSGSLVRWLVAAEPRDAQWVHDSVASLRATLNTGWLDNSRGLEAVVAPLFRLFAPGRYSMEWLPSRPRLVDTYQRAVGQYGNGLFSSQVPYVTFERQHFFAEVCESRIVAGTQESVDPNVVEQYRKRIAAGERPIIFAVCMHAADRVILDGHHKCVFVEEGYAKVLPRGRVCFNGRA